MILKDLMEIEPGTLLKSKKTADKNSLDIVFVDKYSNNENCSDTQIQILYCDNDLVIDLIEQNKIQEFKPHLIKWSILRCNGRIYHDNIKKYYKYLTIEGEQCLGMSLGSTIVAIQPTNISVVRPEFYEIVIFHKVLFGTKILWLLLKSKTRHKSALIVEPDSLLPFVEINIL
jgi:hypothetical protein